MFLQEVNIVGDLIAAYGLEAIGFTGLIWYLVTQNKESKKRIKELEERQDANNENNIKEVKEMITSYNEAMHTNGEILSSLTECIKTLKGTLEKIEVTLQEIKRNQN